MKQISTKFHRCRRPQRAICKATNRQKLLLITANENNVDDRYLVFVDAVDGKHAPV